MTDIKWGDPIPVDGKRPDWLRGDEIVRYDMLIEPARSLSWTGVLNEYRLLADHPYYTVQRHNAQNGTNFTYWPGGENAPDDWDRGKVLLREYVSTIIPSPSSWERGYDGDPDKYAELDVIGYTRRAEPAATPVPEWSLTRVREITGSDAIEYAFARYIEQHEQPPVDPDVLAVREILAAWYNDTFIGTAKRVEDGDYDSSDWFLKALAAYRKHRQ